MGHGNAACGVDAQFCGDCSNVPEHLGIGEYVTGRLIVKKNPRGWDHRLRIQVLQICVDGVLFLDKNKPWTDTLAGGFIRSNWTRLSSLTHFL